jgi:hypothetical protein
MRDRIEPRMKGDRIRTLPERESASPDRDDADRDHL